MTHIKTDTLDKSVTDSKATTKRSPRLNTNSKLYKTIIKAIEDKKGEKIVTLDLRKIEEAVADYFIICEAQSNTQISAIAANVEKEVHENCSEKAYHTQYGAHWTLLDYVNIVVHVFDRDQRKFYDIEGLWADAVHAEIG
ncbi:MAG TPA: ribosome silencing factor [Chitinophagaceae bacterium]|nr:ribosome silencing factor [Chitinophagaceae bacterium]